ncbi:unnamed protein product [Candidula unifasciata]|uniref:Major facilitator superfamily (MFS) profile domain-containing protein n=1 Tax=Candidula unifasciata TaxID=100452 RepID=A0A8S3ZY26_9EUPU|nr:unnamed protein product [Candidula unifasciata]
MLKRDGSDSNHDGQDVNERCHMLKRDGSDSNHDGQDVNERCHMLKRDMSDSNRDGQDVELAARHGGSGSDECCERQTSTPSASPPPASGHDHLDGGYGWLVVVASFFVAFVIDGIGSSFGLLFPYIVAKFDSSAFVTSFAGSTIVAFMIMGSISVALVKKFGYRPVAVLGSILSCVAFVVSVFSPNIYVFIVTFGLLGGCSCGLVYIPSIIIVNEYFHQKRGLANGIISSGSGVGLLVLGPVINLLLETYSLNGTILLLAGVLLNMCVCSSLFIPLDHGRQYTPSVVDDREQHGAGQPTGETLSSHLSTENLDTISMDNGQNMQKVADLENQGNTKPAFEAGEVVSRYCQVYLGKSATAPFSSHDEGDHASYYLECVLHHLKPGVPAAEYSGDTRVASENLLKQESKDVEAVGSCAYPGGDHRDVESQHSLQLEYTLTQLLCMPSFHCFCLGAALIQIGYPLAGTFLANYAYQFGLTTSHTAILMSLLGGLNICGRLLAGSLVSLKVDPLLLNNLSLLLGGAACLLSPLYTQFWSLCIFASMFGFFLGFFPPLQPLIIVKHFGLETLASAFGFLSTIKGIASILGAPLAGFIYDVTRQYSMSFMFGGAVFVLSSLVHCLMTVTERFCRKKSQL